MSLNNWANYFTRTYDQIVDTVLVQLGIAAPEITDRSDGNPLIRGIEVWAGIVEWLHYYIDNAAREIFLSSARRYRSAVAFARFSDYRIHNASPASANVTFSIPTAQSTDIVIPKSTKVTNSDNTIDFYTTATVTIPAGQTHVSATVTQISQSLTTVTTTGTGQALQAFKIGNDAADGYVSLKVNGISWYGVDTFFNSKGTASAFQQNVSYNGDSIIMFGDGVRGGVPAAGQAIIITYQTTLGSAGNIGAGLINTIQTTITSPVTVSVINVNQASGGADTETLASLKRNIPSARRTLMRGVTKTDYKALSEMVAGVSRAAVDNTCGNIITVYIVPVGGGLATTDLTSQVVNFLDDKKILGRSVNVVSAGVVRLVFDISIKATAGYSATTVSSAVIANLLSFLSTDNQEIGATVELGDIYQILETTIGVDNSRIAKMTTIPYARPLNGGQTILDWNVQTLEASKTTAKWRIVIVQVQTTLSRFQLFKDNTYKGTFSTGVQVVMPEVQFTLNQKYALGLSWEFYTYNYFGTISLTEMSLPTTTTPDINITFR